ncbi:ABC transporter substrate-binding protein [Pusillimonas caeni]|uniref:ABC transporter substrate-binding protein n=1 Tax=Pusillimonas caeni TaxID=1348472 RepID=UPI000E59FF8B|nr:ABC transporter substrate-binding protein [Pusillimonas caeni]TFL15680.1 ABC transporter substrate-binding protein [Pusillimonas caeni]
MIEAFYRRPSWAIALLTAAALTVPLTAGAEETSGAVEEVMVLTPAPPTLPAFAPWVIAQSRGYYADEGLKVNLMAANGGAVQVAKQVGAGIAIAGSSVGDAPLFLRANGVPIKVVAMLGGRSLMRVVVSADNEAIQTPKDLKGKTITTSSYTDSVYYNFLGMMAQYGVKKGDMNIQAAGPNGIWKLFSTGDADAMIAVPDSMASAVEAGANVKVFYAEDYFPGLAQAIVASDQVIKDRPDLVKKIVSATLRAMKDIMDDPEALAKEFIQVVPSYVGRESYVSEVIMAYAKNVYPGQQVLGQMDEERLRALQDFYLKEGLLEKRMPLSDVYTNQFVE